MLNLNWIVIAFAVSAAPQEGASGDRTLKQEFALHSELLKKPGIHFSGKWVFSTSHNFRKTDSEWSEIKFQEAELNAIREILLWKVAKAAPLSNCSSALRNAHKDIALSCLKQVVELRSLQNVFSQEVGNQLIVVHGIPKAEFDRIQFDLVDVVSCIFTRAEAGRISVPEALVLLELCPNSHLSRAREIALQTLSDSYGIGIKLSVRGAWMSSDEQMPTLALQSWCKSIQQGVANGKDLQTACAPIELKILDALDIEERLEVFGHRMHDPNVRSAVVAKLVSDGWLRTAELFSANPIVVSTPADHSGSKIPPELRGKIAATPFIALLLISNGQAPVQLSIDVEEGTLNKAREAFNRIELPELIRAATFLQEAISLHPDQESITLLGATLLALDDPSLARLICSAAFKNNPAYPNTAVNLLIALRRLDMRAEARVVLDQVQSDASIHRSKWEMKQITSISEWLDPKTSAQ